MTIVIRIATFLCALMAFASEFGPRRIDLLVCLRPDLPSAGALLDLDLFP